MDPNGACRIRRARGRVSDQGITFGEGLPAAGIGLPNQSGWMHDSDLGPVLLGKLKDAFRKQYPRYANTIYPQGTTTTLSVWKSDPNNVGMFPESFKSSRGLPMPPDRNAVLTNDGENPPTESGDPESQRAPQEGTKKKANAKKGSPNKTNQKKNEDKTYRDVGGEESQDEEPEPGDVQNDLPQSEPTKKRKRNAATTGPVTTVEPSATDEPLTTTEPSRTPGTTAAAENVGATQRTVRHSKIIIKSNPTGGQARSATEEPAAAREEQDEEGEPKRKKSRTSA